MNLFSEVAHNVLVIPAYGSPMVEFFCLAGTGGLFFSLVL